MFVYMLIANFVPPVVRSVNVVEVHEHTLFVEKSATRGVVII